MKEARNILRILRESKIILEKGNALEMKKLSNQTIHSATISQDADNIIVAVLIYSLGKIFSRENYRKMEGWDKFNKSVFSNLDLAIKSLENNDAKKAREALARIRNSINYISGNLSRYIKDVFEKSRINKAFKLYEHGLSSGQTAELLGISSWDLATYIGQSPIHESKHAIGIPVNKRVKLAEDFFL